MDERWCFVIVEELRDLCGFKPMRAIENQSGLVVVDTSVRWGPTIEEARAIAKEWNAMMQLSETDVAEIIASTVEK